MSLLKRQTVFSIEVFVGMGCVTKFLVDVCRPVEISSAISYTLENTKLIAENLKFWYW